MPQETSTHDVAALATDLVAIPSDPPRHAETAMATHIKAMVEQRGCYCVEIPTTLGTGRHDLLVLSQAIDSKDIDSIASKGLLFSAHMDVVPPGDPLAWERNRLEPWIDDRGYLHGRGSTDMKGGMAAFIAAFLNNLDALTKARNALIGLLFTVDEETSLAGANAFVASPWAKLFGMAILPEPTGLQPVRGHKGVAFIRFTIDGKAAHGAVPDRGVNAITVGISIYKEIEAQYNTIRKARTHPVLGPPTMNLGMMHGGEQVNVVPDRCVFAVDRRIGPGESNAAVVAEIINAAKSYPLPAGASMSHDVVNSKPPYFLDDGHPFLRSVCALAGPPSIMNGYTEAGIFFNEARIPTIIIGPGTINEAHVINEKVAISELQKAERLYARFMLDHVGK